MRYEYFRTRNTVKKGTTPQGGVTCPQDSKLRFNCSFSPSQECNFKPVSLDASNLLGKTPATLPPKKGDLA